MSGSDAQGGHNKAPVEHERLMELDIEDFANEQQTGNTLLTYWTQARLGSSEFIMQGGLLYRITDPKVNTSYTTGEYLWVVPEKFRLDLISMAHDNLYGAHIGVGKTRKRLLMYFWWPKLNKMTAQYM